MFPASSSLCRLMLAVLVAAAPQGLRSETVQELEARETRVREVVSRVSPSVVAITSSDPKRPGSGSGVIVEKSGLILTAAHVTEATGKNLIITFPDGRRVKGEALGANRSTDAGLARITDDGDWPSSEIGSSDRMRLGDWVVALGHPGGFSYERRPPVRLGRIWRRDVDGAIFSSCPLIGGDSGGPLFDLEGRVIGINSSIHGSVEMNRHVAIDTLRADWDDMMKDKTWGTKGFRADERRRPRTGAMFDRDSQDGVRIENVSDNSPAAAAGWKSGDFLIRFDGQDVATFHALQRLMAKKKSGDKVAVALRRGSETIEGEIELTRAGSIPAPSDPDGEDKDGPPAPKVPNAAPRGPFFGIEVEDSEGKGARITNVKDGSPAARAGLVPGDLLIRANDRDIATPADAADLLRSLKSGDKLNFKARRGESDFSGEATLDQNP